MLRYGRLCRECPPGRCCDDSGNTIDCPECGGKGGKCQECDDGEWTIPGCPHLSITPETWEAIELAGHADHGLPPVSGGTLDQAAWFLAAWRFVRGEEGYWKRALRVND